MKPEIQRFHIRPGTPDDASLLRTLGRETFMESYADRNDPDNMQQYIGQHFSVRAIEAELKDPNARFFILEEGGVAAGYAQLRRTERVVALEGLAYSELARLYLRASCQGQGMGKALLAHCLDCSRSAGDAVIWLGVWKENHKAIDFYTRAGFRIFGEHIFTLGHEEQTDWIMRHDFAQAMVAADD
jgi:ribosomal protein S18 acetylase RimI-like enzyme